MEAAIGAAPQSLPALRQELRIERGAKAPGGVASWLIVDPVQHRYLQIDETAYHLLSKWNAELTASQLAASAEAEFGLHVTADDVSRFAQFLSLQNFTVEPPEGRWRHYAETNNRSKHSWAMSLAHNYLYFKIPLFRPERTLQTVVPYFSPIYSMRFAALIVAIGFVGLYLVSRQWAVFEATFQNFMSLEGALTYAVALILVKSAHELGHAVTAARYGCRVPSMGVCLLVMFPVLYTDVTDAWRLTDRHKRLAIGSAGIAVELTLACIATLLWVFLPDGPLRGVMFSIATVGWVLSLAINLNPLMRFDGYYLLSDFIGVDNLQDRAFAFGKWKMREVLFGLDATPPEVMPAAKQRILVAYAWMVWVYRLVVFTGIALLVYHMTFKVLGIILFLIEIVFFILMPLASEFMAWRREGAKLRAGRRTSWTVGVAVWASILFLFPWSSRVSLPATIEAGQIAWVYPQRAGEIVELRVRPGDKVKTGDVIAVMRSTEIEHQLAIAKQKLDLVRMRLARRAADAKELSDSLSLEHEVVSLTAELDGYKSELELLKIRAPITGTVSEVNQEAHRGRSIGRSELIALVSGSGDRVVRGYVNQQQAARLKGIGMSNGSFLADVPGFGRIRVRLESVAPSSSPSIEMPGLTSQYGGPIAVRKHGSGRDTVLAPVNAMYLVTLSLEGTNKAPNFSALGSVDIEGERQSFADRFFQQVAAVLIRESGF